MKQIVPLGDQAALAYFQEEAEALRFANHLRADPPDWLIDVVPAYASVAVFFELPRMRFAAVATELRELETAGSFSPTEGKLHRIPCCYEFQLDLERVARATGLATDAIINLHTGCVYTVYALGFCPGFPYLGYLPAELANVPRLESPRLRVPPGSVGLTGKQTGIYTMERPGGWNLIGRTPLELVNVADGYFPLRAGERVQFVRIDEGEFARQLGQRLES
ncbi:MAG: allophanate hydrolase subunit 1 [Gemmataceae bacterium]